MLSVLAALAGLAGAVALRSRSPKEPPAIEREEPEAPGEIEVEESAALVIEQVADGGDAGSGEPAAVINEIHYHPASRDPRDEWIEIHNPGALPIDIGGWKLDGGVQLVFPARTEIAPGGYLVAGADQERLRETLGSSRVTGNWTGSLKNSGDEIRLLDREGKEMDAVAYNDRGPFPVLADGLGHSLERRNPRSSGAFPGNWGAGGRAGWTRFRAQGTVTRDRFYAYLQGPGTVYLDDVSLKPARGGEELIQNGGFEDGGRPWVATGNHSGSRVTDEAARSGERSLKIFAPGAGGSSGASVNYPGVPLGVDRTLVLEFWALFTEPRTPLVLRFSGARDSTTGLLIEARPGGFTPGARNSLATTELPPFIYPATHSPPAPGPRDEVVIRSLVVSTRPATVLLHYDAGSGERSAVMEDEGGVHAARVGPFPPGTLVRYRLSAVDAAGLRGGFPLAGGPTRTLGFAVLDPAERGALPTYEILMSPGALRDLDSNPYSDAYRPGTFVCEGRAYCDVGIRYRGHTSRGIQKHHWKVKFNKDQPFEPPVPGHGKVSSININSSFGDKTFLREILGYNLWRDLGEASCESWHVRMRLNGEHLGLYVHVENPGDDYLDRNGLDEGWLWKAYEGWEYGIRSFELKAGDPASGIRALEDFAQGLESLRGPQLESFLRERMHVDSFLSFLAACQLTHSADHVQKNYLVYMDPGRKLTYYPWDLDLTHGRNFECSGGGIWNDQIRHDLWDRETRDEKLLFGTQVHPKCDGYTNLVMDAFLRRTNAFRPLYYRRLAEHLAHHYHPDVLIPKIERLRDRIRGEVERDRERWRTYGSDAGFDHDCAALIRWVRNRFTHLKSKLEALGHPVGPPLNACFDLDVRTGPAPLQVAFKDLSAGSITEREWSFGDGAASREAAPVHTYSKPGRHDVVLKVKGAGGEHAWTWKSAVIVRKGNQP
ncbi:MAG TPA: CotH kinase family protein [Planctomycetota bacterium]|nr:CotH kinase family protein [Planctomycetota bacterium]